MNKLTKLLNLCPCPVTFNLQEVGINGGMYTDQHSSSWGCRIDVGPCTSEAKKLHILAHELGHALCDTKECDCMKTLNYSKSEYHAMKFAAKWLLDHNCKRGLQACIRSTERLSLNKYHPKHCKAAKQVMKLRLWGKCKEYVAKKKHEC